MVKSGKERKDETAKLGSVSHGQLLHPGIGYSQELDLFELLLTICPLQISCY